MPTAHLHRRWVADAVRALQADANRTSDTHMHRVEVPGMTGVDIYLKDESTHPTGSLKHRLARSLFLHALCNGMIGPQTTVVEASSGSTAVSEAHFARMLGLPFVAVMAQSTSPEKIRLIEREGGTCRLIADPKGVYDEARQLAEDSGGIYLDQFTNAERATDWRGNNNIAESIFSQLSMEPHPVPRWIVVGAGTGGTSATIGRFLRYRAHETALCVVDPEGSAFLPSWRAARATQSAPSPARMAAKDPCADACPSRIEGIGRARLEPSFVPSVVDAMLPIPDAASVAAMRLLRERTGIHAGPSTGTNLVGVLSIAAHLHAECHQGSIVSLVCDRGDRYDGTYGDDAWLAQRGLSPDPYAAPLAAAWDDGTWDCAFWGASSATSDSTISNSDTGITPASAGEGEGRA